MTRTRTRPFSKDSDSESPLHEIPADRPSPAPQARQAQASPPLGLPGEILTRSSGHPHCQQRERERESRQAWLTLESQLREAACREARDVRGPSLGRAMMSCGWGCASTLVPDSSYKPPPCNYECPPGPEQESSLGRREQKPVPEDTQSCPDAGCAAVVTKRGCLAGRREGGEAAGAARGPQPSPLSPP